MRRFKFEEGADVSEDIRTKYGFDGDLLRLGTERDRCALLDPSGAPR